MVLFGHRRISVLELQCYTPQSVIGLGFAAISFIAGNPNAKQHITYAIVGAVVGFGAQAIVDFIASTVH